MVPRPDLVWFAVSGPEPGAAIAARPLAPSRSGSTRSRSSAPTTRTTSPLRPACSRWSAPGVPRWAKGSTTATARWSSSSPTRDPPGRARPVRRPASGAVRPSPRSRSSKRWAATPGPTPTKGGGSARPARRSSTSRTSTYRSTVATFAEALRQIRTWSAAHPGHVPILVQIELKENPVLGLPTRPAKFGPPGLDAVDREIRAAFPGRALLTPDDVRGSPRPCPTRSRTQGGRSSTTSGGGSSSPSTSSRDSRPLPPGSPRAARVGPCSSPSPPATPPPPG